MTMISATMMTALISVDGEEDVDDGTVLVANEGVDLR